jgi:hypothetical protein
MNDQPEYKTICKFDRVLAGLQGGNNLPTKATTIENIEPITGESESFIVQTIRAEYKVNVSKGWETTTETRVGDFIVLKYLDKDGTKRLILPPKVAETIERQHKALSKKNRTNVSKAAMKQRMADGYVPEFARKGAGAEL